MRCSEHVLAVAGAVTQPAEQGDHLGVHLGDADLDQRVFAGADALRLDGDLGPLVLLLDALRMDAPVEHQRFQGHPADFAAYRIEAGQQNGFRGVVDDDVDAGHGLVRADVAALAADDPAFHVVARQVEHRDDRLRGLLAGDALDGEGDDTPGPVLAFGSCLGLDVAHDQRGITLGLRFGFLHQFGPGLVGGEPGDLLEDATALFFDVGQLSFAPGDVGFGTGQLMLASNDLVGFLLEPLRALFEPHFPADQPLLPLVEFVAGGSDLLQLDLRSLGRRQARFTLRSCAQLGDLSGDVRAQGLRLFAYPQPGTLGLGARPLTGLVQFTADQLGRLPTGLGQGLLAGQLHRRVVHSNGLALGRCRSWRAAAHPALHAQQREAEADDGDENQREEYRDQRVHPSSSCRDERSSTATSVRRNAERADRAAYADRSHARRAKMTAARLIPGFDLPSSGAPAAAAISSRPNYFAPQRSCGDPPACGAG